MLSMTQRLMIDLGHNPRLRPQDLEDIPIEVLLGIGERDTMVSLEETTQASENLRNSKVKVLPDMPHPIEQVDLDLLITEIENFFD